jgi:hypothetical protein
VQQVVAPKLLKALHKLLNPPEKLSSVPSQTAAIAGAIGKEVQAEMT